MEATIKQEQLYQVWAIETATGNLVPFPYFPRIGKEAADELLATLKAMIASGKEKRYTEPQSLPHLAP